MSPISFRLIIPALVLILAAPVLGQGGTIEGKVDFTSRPPRRRLIPMGADPNCLKINAGKKIFHQAVVLDANQGLANVFLHIKGDVPGGTVPSEPVVIEQQGCIYHPHVAGIVLGQVLRVTNGDATLHNVNSTSKLKGNGFNVSQPQKGMTRDFELGSEEAMLRLQCNVHNWMEGYLGVVRHPYFAVSGADGSFKISGVPPGTHTVEAWHEVYGAQTLTVEVKAGATATLSVSYPAEKSAAATPELEMRDFVLPAQHEAHAAQAER